MGFSSNSTILESSFILITPKRLTSSPTGMSLQTIVISDFFSIWYSNSKPEVRNYFRDEPRIYSKVDDLPPAKYNVGSDVRNSLVSSGCIINSKVENSILFKKVFVGKNCVIKNSIILNDVYIGDNTHIENCIVESRDTRLA